MNGRAANEDNRERAVCTRSTQRLQPMEPPRGSRHNFVGILPGRPLWTRRKKRCLAPGEDMTAEGAAGFSEGDVQSAKLLYCQLAHALGRKLRLRQRAISTACFFFNKFFSSRSMLEHDPLLVVATAVWIASKVEECSTQASRVIREMGELGAGDGSSYTVADLHACELTVLEAIKFDLIIANPYSVLSRILAQADLRAHLGAEKTDCLVQAAYFLLNDCFRCDLVLDHSPEILALGCALCASLLEHAPIRHLLPEPASRNEREGVERVAAGLLALYERSQQLGKGDLAALHHRLLEARAACRAQHALAASSMTGDGTAAHSEPVVSVG